ncbi:MAG: helix-turn-helix domain-containing protein [Draconibacterium sp.]|nr:helix-turn-helix domain-containing protein [Draconibacterium sp.]
MFVIAVETGFSEHSYFSAVFKKNFELSPSEFRQNEELNSD